MLASDLNNPAFVGASNPDDQMTVQFYVKPVQNNAKTAAEGRPIFEDVIFCKIFTPGDQLNIIDTPASDSHAQRFPRQWAMFQNMRGTDTRMIGTPLDQWPRLTPAQAEELKAMRFFSVEQIAGASDEHILRIGMLSGMSPYAFRDAARNYLAVARGEADQTKNTTELERIREEAAQSQAAAMAMIRDLQEQLASLKEAKRPGRPRRETEPEPAETGQ